jgi:hypothetical protein
MIRPIDSMSISVVSMMNGIAAAWFLRNIRRRYYTAAR